jgi:hypothetical protein
MECVEDGGKKEYWRRAGLKIRGLQCGSIDFRYLSVLVRLIHKPDVLLRRPMEKGQPLLKENNVP